jgi:uroporphyrin-III C-methyltransferase/precorrin-2 dehydrogenase/sirohydrochlorin ferrochelatase
LKLEGRRVLVVGGGSVAERKVVDLLAARAEVCVVASEPTDRVRALAEKGAIRLERRPFEDTDADDAWLVVAATDDRATQARARAAADARRVFCLAVDDVAHATAYSAALLRRGPFTIAISSSGAAPALTRLVREILEAALPEESFVEAAKTLRKKWKREGTPMNERFRELVDALRDRRS